MNVAGNLARGVAKLTPAPPMAKWVHHAACAGLDPALFHPHRGDNTDAAKTVCDRCPVQAECLDYALRTNQQHGIWGGISEKARRRMRFDDPDILGSERQCPACGDTFQARRISQRFCCADCRNYHRTAWSRQ